MSSYLQNQVEPINAYLEHLFPESGRYKSLLEAMNYSLLAGGKRLRPALCMAAARTFGVPEETSLPAAAALELVHCYSLIHDDLPCMDDDDLRRGRPTNHRVFGEARALLAGDALLTYAFEQLSKPLPVAPLQQLEMIRTLASAAGCFGMVAGQSTDMEMENEDGDLETLQFIHLHKTSALIRASVEIGGLFVELPDTKRLALKRYGEKLGLAFQVVDDWLDEVADTETLGKTAGKDVATDKLTYPKLLGLAATNELAKKLVNEALSELRKADIDAPLLEELALQVVNRAN